MQAGQSPGHVEPGGGAGPGAIRVMRVYSRLEVGGIEYQLLRVLPLLAQGRFQPSLCLLKRPGEMAPWLRERGIDLHVIPFRSRLNPRNLRELAALFRGERISIVHAHVRESNTSATIAARLARVPVVIGSIHNMNTVTGRRRVLQERIVERFRDQTVCVSEGVKRNYCETVGVDPDRVTVIYNGLDASIFDAIPRANPELRASFGIPESHRIVTCVARLNASKRHETLLLAAARVVARLTQTTFLFVGEGARLEPLQEEARRLGVSSQVIFAGKRDDVPRILRMSDLFALTSTREGFSNAIVEALAAGLPAVVTDVGGNAEAIEEGVSGHLLPAGDAEGIAAQIVTLLEDDARRAHFSEAARRRADRFSLENSVRATEALYDRLLSR